LPEILDIAKKEVNAFVQDKISDLNDALQTPEVKIVKKEIKVEGRKLTEEFQKVERDVKKFEAKYKDKELSENQFQQAQKEQEILNQRIEKLKLED